MTRLAKEAAAPRSTTKSQRIHRRQLTPAHLGSQGHREKLPTGKRTEASSKKRGQQAIDSARAREIQEALIREHYMQGEPSGTWDAPPRPRCSAIRPIRDGSRRQTPDSRALIKLGLGPSHDHLLNPESAMTTTTPRHRARRGDPKAAAKPDPAGETTFLSSR